MGLVRDTYTEGGLSWSTLLVVFEMKTGSRTNSKTGATRKTQSSQPARTLADKHKHTSPYTTDMKDGATVYLHPRLQGARYGANVLSASMPLRRYVPVAVVSGARVEMSVVDRSNLFVSPEAGLTDGFAATVAILVAAVSCGSHALGWEPTLVADDEFPTQWGDAEITNLLPPFGHHTFRPFSRC